MRESDIFTADGKVPTYLREKNDRQGEETVRSKQGKQVRAREDGCFFDHGRLLV